jgi:cathepsin O
MRLIILFSFLLFVLHPVQLTAIDGSENEDDFDLENIRVKKSPDYGGGLGGPLAAGIRQHRPDKDEQNVTQKPYQPVSNIKNSKKCEVVRLRKTVAESKGISAKEKASREFDAYVKKYNKVYLSDDAKEKARDNYINGRDGAHKLNGGRCSNEDAQFSTTRYSDWTTEDFIDKLGGARQDLDPKNLPPKYTVTEDQSRFLYELPRLDWRDYGIFPAVRDQKDCGGCYAFSTTDLLAAQERIDKKKFKSTPVEPYSAQYFIDCMPEPYGFACKGGRPAAVLDYMSTCKDCVILIERCYQYRNRNLRCKQPSINCRDTVGAKPIFSKQVSLISTREAEAMASLLRWGPVVAVVELGPAWQYYNGTGIIRDGHCGKKPNHAILIVGYDYTGDVPYYIVRNSWSDEWGIGGYVKVEAGTNTCGIATAALVTCTDSEKCGNGKFDKIEDFVDNPNAKPDLLSDGTYSS